MLSILFGIECNQTKQEEQAMNSKTNGPQNRIWQKRLHF